MNSDMLQTELEEKNSALEELRDKRMRGYQVRSREEFIKGWEKPSKFFLNLEKKNYINKTIVELIDEDQKTINDPVKILNLQKDFYQDLFTKKQTIPISGSFYEEYLQNIPKLSEAKKKNLDMDFTMDELEYVIVKSKLNKSPGPSGFTNEFLKLFIHELSVWLLRAYNDSYKSGSLTRDTLLGTITCIPKSGKQRNSLKNWRPLTLLNCTYKYLSAMIANRIKSVLEELISTDQTGFISNRFIGENTRLLYDTIDYCHNENIDGLLIVVDYSKAFDTIEWNYIDQCLNLFNFGDNLISWVRLLRSNSISRVEQNGHFTSIFELSRGCRQGDPISPYIFVLCAEFLAHVIRENSDIKGIMVHNKEVKISLYADDTTIYIKAERDSMCGVMRVLDWFKKISGLGVNIEKTKVIKIGRSRDRSIAWEGKYNLKWTDEFEVLGISYNIHKMGEISDHNILNKLKDIKKIVTIWKTRRLTPYGKVVIIKSLLFSKFTHILLSLPTPGKETFKTINNLVKDFLWEGKPPKFRKEILEADTQFGGMKLHNLELFDAALKVGWLKRYLRSSAKWCVIPDDFELFNVFKYGLDFLERIQEMTENSFWKDVLNSLRVLGKKDGFISSDNILLTPLWHNPQLRLQIKKNWLENGVQIISDLLDDDMKPYSLKLLRINSVLKQTFWSMVLFAK